MKYLYILICRSLLQKMAQPPATGTFAKGSIEFEVLLFFHPFYELVISSVSTKSTVLSPDSPDQGGPALCHGAEKDHRPQNLFHYHQYKFLQ